jgi:Leucine-rich repeat (LRR) protein
MDELAAFVEKKDGVSLQNELGDICLVELANQNVDDLDLDIFKQSCANEITHLYLNGTQISDEGLAKLASLQHLNDLDLGYTTLTGAGFAKVKFTSLKKLTFRGCDQLTVDGFKQIVKCQNLEKLDLYESNIDDPFLQEIAKLPKLKTLWADHTRLTNAGLPYLNNMTQLRSFTLDKTAITREGMQQLWKHLPDLNNGFIM